MSDILYSIIGSVSAFWLFYWLTFHILENHVPTTRKLRTIVFLAWFIIGPIISIFFVAWGILIIKHVTGA
jgi:hypothetical protein